MLILTSPALTILAVLVGIVVYTRLSRVLGLVIVAIAVFNGIYSTNYPFDRILTGGLFVLAVLVALLMLMFSLLVAYSRLVESVGRTAAVAAVIIALLNSFWAAPGMVWDTVSGNEMRNYVAQQIDATNGRVNDLFNQVNAPLAGGGLAERVAALEGRMDRAEADIKALQEGHGELKDKIEQAEATLNGVVLTHTAADLDREAFYEKVAQDMAGAGWGPGQFTIGNVDWSKSKLDRGRNSFTNHTLKTQDEVREFINGTSAASQAARAYLLDKVPASEHERLLSGVGFVPIQANEAFCLDGNTYFDGSKAVNMTNQRCHEAGYVLWVYVAANGDVYWDAMLASHCANPGAKAVPAPKEKSSSKQPAKVCEEGDYKGRTPMNGSCYKPVKVIETPKPSPTPENTPAPEPSDSPSPSPEPTQEPTPTPAPEPKQISVCRDNVIVKINESDKRATDTTPFKGDNGRWVCKKAAAPQPDKVEKPVDNPPAPVASPRPTPKPTPLKPNPAPTSATPTQAPHDGNTAEQPNQGGPSDSSSTPPPVNDGTVGDG